MPISATPEQQDAITRQLEQLLAQDPIFLNLAEEARIRARANALKILQMLGEDSQTTDEVFCTITIALGAFLAANDVLYAEVENATGSPE